jgi:ankyrin repeat protein
VEFLISKGANINVYCTNGTTPLIRATVIFGGDKEMVKPLIAKGADMNFGDPRGWTPLHIVAQCGLTEIAEILIANGADVNAVDKGGRYWKLIFSGKNSHLPR